MFGTIISIMSGVGGTPLFKLMAAIREFQACEDRPFDAKELRVAIDTARAEQAEDEE